VKSPCCEEEAQVNQPTSFIEFVVTIMSSTPKRSIDGPNDDERYLKDWLAVHKFETKRLSNGFKYYNKKKYRSSPFEEAIKERNIRIQKLLWDRTAIKDAKQYQSLLYTAASRGLLESLKWLCEEVGVEINAQTPDIGCTAVGLACINREFECCQYLLSRGADVRIPNVFGDTPLMRACQDDDEEAASWIFSGKH
jgi:ankyrin repeat protein